MRGRIIRLARCGLLCATAALAFSPAASAAEEPLEPEVRSFRLGGSNGYELIATASPYGPLGDKGGHIAISVSRQGATAIYSTRAEVTPTSIRADLGALGRVDLTVRPSGRTRKAAGFCGQGKEAFETGRVEGSIVFRGEGGYTSVSASRAPLIPWFAGYVPRFRSFGPCGGGGESAGPGISGARLKAVSYSGGRTLSFQINKNRPKSRTIYRASLAERHHGIAIYREVHGITGSAAFGFGRSLRTATLSPPAPFAGTATARRDPDAVSPLWSGGLTLDFPGRLDFPLAGPGVHVSLIHSRLHRGDGSSIATSYGRWPSTKS